MANDARLQTASDLTTKINTEKERALLAETDLQKNINTEQSARISQDESLTNKLNSEIQRATDAEVLLQSNIDKEKSERILETKTLKNDLVDETDRATTAELKLQSNIDVEKGRIDSMLLAASADLDSFKQVVDLINSVDTTNDTAFSGYVLSNDARSKIIEDGLKDEIKRADDSEKLIQSNVDKEIVDRKTANDTLLKNINDELSRATTEEQKLQSNIDTEKSNRETADTKLQSNIDVEKSRINAILDSSYTNLASFKQVVDLINSVDTKNDTEFSNYALSNNKVINDIMDGTTPVSKSNTLTTSRLISLSGDLSGSVSFDGSSNVTITATILEDSHTHPIGAVDGLQNALDGKQPLDASTVHDAKYVHTDNNYTSDEKIKLTGIESGAQVNKVTSVAGKDGAVTLNIADIIVDGHIIPTQDIAFDLGSETHRFRDLWLSSNTIKMGDFGISVTENGTITTSHLSNPNSSVDEILTDTDIGVLVQRYDVSTVHDAKYVHTDNNYTTDEKTKLSYLTVTQAVDLDGIESKLNGVENGATADQTASEILELLTTVDGENSGIDADLLDGKHGSHYQPAETAVTVNSEFGGDVSGNFNSIVIKDNSHQHSSENISDATDTNVVSTIVKRDAFGNFYAGQITAELKGNSTTSTTLKNPRNINGVAFDGSSDITINAVDSTARIAESKLGTANGVATLDSNGKVPSTQLPSYVDDVLEFDTTSLFPETGDTGILYVALDTNKVYRWSGTTYIYITSGAVDSVAGKKGVVTLADMGLDNVDNTSDMNKPVSTAQAEANALIKNDASTDATEKANVAQANAIAASAPASHVGSGDNAHTTATTSTHGFMSSDDKQKLDGIATGATNYAHPEFHPAHIIEQDTNHRFVTDVEKENWNAKQSAGNYATLDANGKVPVTQLPSSVDDVLEFSDFSYFPQQGITGIIYVDLQSTKVYVWSDTSYVDITSGSVDSVNNKTGVVVLDKTDIGLENVDNTSDMNKPVSTAQAEANALIKNDASTDATEKANVAQANAIAASAPASHVGSGDNAHTTATTSTHGFMSSDDKQKLDGIAQNANNYPGTSISQVNTTSNDIFYPIMTHVSESAINDAVVSTDKLKFDAFTGQLSATNFNSTSDAKKKTNVKTIEGALDLVMSMRGVEFNWIDTGLHGIGVIAQEVESVIPQIVSTDTNGDKSVAYGNIIGILIEAIKQQQLMINQLLQK